MRCGAKPDRSNSPEGLQWQRRQRHNIRKIKPFRSQTGEPDGIDASASSDMPRKPLLFAAGFHWSNVTGFVALD